MPLCHPEVLRRTPRPSRKRRGSVTPFGAERVPPPPFESGRNAIFVTACAMDEGSFAPLRMTRRRAGGVVQGGDARIRLSTSPSTERSRRWIASPVSFGQLVLLPPPYCSPSSFPV